MCAAWCRCVHRNAAPFFGARLQASNEVTLAVLVHAGDDAQVGPLRACRLAHASADAAHTALRLRSRCHLPRLSRPSNLVLAPRSTATQGPRVAGMLVTLEDTAHTCARTKPRPTALRFHRMSKHRKVCINKPRADQAAKRQTLLFFCVQTLLFVKLASAETWQAR